jgi:hypothetical protein
MKKALSIFFLFLFAICVKAQNTSVEDIVKNPSWYTGRNVTVKGLVTIYNKGEGNTKYYYLRGDYGAYIRINTAEGSPELNQMFIVQGIVYVDHQTSMPFISEKARVKNTEIAKTPTPVPAPAPTPFSFLKSNYMIFALVGVIIVLVVLILVLKVFRSRDKLTSDNAKLGYDYKLPGNETIRPQGYDDFKTIKISAGSEKTLKFIPGKLTIISGEDSGRSFKIAGYPANEGSVVTIGREEITGERAYSHIHLRQKTISKKQAELVYFNNQVFVKNISGTNYTQLNGVELKENEKAEIKTGDVLRFGELEIKYEV